MLVPLNCSANYMYHGEYASMCDIHGNVICISCMVRVYQTIPPNQLAHGPETIDVQYVIRVLIRVLRIMRIGREERSALALGEPAAKKYTRRRLVLMRSAAFQSITRQHPALPLQALIICYSLNL